MRLERSEIPPSGISFVAEGLRSRQRRDSFTLGRLESGASQPEAGKPRLPLNLGHNIAFANLHLSKSLYNSYIY
jgi:hypothetical protein